MWKAAPFVLLSACAPSAQAPLAQTAQGLNCVALDDVTSTEILDDNHMLFHLRDGPSLRMDFPSVCTGLTQAGQFTFAPEKSRLCAGDVVQVVSQRPVPSLAAQCNLGHFWPQPSHMEPLHPQIGAGKRG